MEYKDTTFTYKMLCKLGFHYPIDDYGDVSIIKVIKQVFVNFWHRLLINMMDWAILEPFAPRKLRPLFARLLGAKVGKDVFIGEYVTFDINHSNLITIEDGVHIAGGAHLLCHKKGLACHISKAKEIIEFRNSIARRLDLFCVRREFLS